MRSIHCIRVAAAALQTFGGGLARPAGARLVGDFPVDELAQRAGLVGVALEAAGHVERMLMEDRQQLD